MEEGQPLSICKRRANSSGLTARALRVAESKRYWCLCTTRLYCKDSTKSIVICICEYHTLKRGVGQSKCRTVHKKLLYFLKACLGCRCPLEGVFVTGMWTHWSDNRCKTRKKIGVPGYKIQKAPQGSSIRWWRIKTAMMCSWSGRIPSAVMMCLGSIRTACI